jgi:hypothetical protein
LTVLDFQVREEDFRVAAVRSSVVETSKVEDADSFIVGIVDRPAKGKTCLVRVR